MTAPAAIPAPAPPGAAAAADAAGISKSFGPTRALRGVDLALQSGRCLGLVGRNGAGKSTMVSILSGLVQPDAGRVAFAGRPAPPPGAVHAWREQIATVHQHSMVVPDLTVAENVFLGRLQGRHGLVSWRGVKAEARRTLEDWGLDIDPAAPCGALTVEQRQLVEIARAVASGTRCLLLDEPTAALEHDAANRLFERVRRLKASGVAVLYISHHLEEVFEICDEVAVLRDGELVLSGPTAGVSREEMIAAMVGHGAAVGPASGSSAGSGAVSDLSTSTNLGVSTRTGFGTDFGSAAYGTPETRAAVARREASGASSHGSTPIFEIDKLHALSPHGGLRDVSLSIASGEQLGVVGLISSGVITLGRIAAGADRAASGSVRLDGRTLPNGQRAAALRAGIGYVPEDRRAEGFVGPLSIAENITMTVTDRLSSGLSAAGSTLDPLDAGADNATTRLGAASAAGSVTARTSGRRFGILRPRAVEAAAAPLAETLSVAAASLRQPVDSLSGGNQQKVVVARALIREPRVLVAVTPTRGVDVASKELLLGALRDAAARGAGVLLATDDLGDLEHCDRVVVLVHGRVAAEFRRDERNAPPGSPGAALSGFDRAALIAAIEGYDPGANGVEARPSSPAGQSPRTPEPPGPRIDGSPSPFDGARDTAFPNTDRKDGAA